MYENELQHRMDERKKNSILLRHRESHWNFGKEWREKKSYSRPLIIKSETCLATVDTMIADPC